MKSKNRMILTLKRIIIAIGFHLNFYMIILYISHKIEN